MLGSAPEALILGVVGIILDRPRRLAIVATVVTAAGISGIFGFLVFAGAL